MNDVTMQVERYCPECGVKTMLNNCPVDGEMTLVAKRKEATASDRIGQLIGGRYKINAVIGQGGFGEVYKAQHASTGDQVAIKVLRQDVQGTADVTARFRQEAKTTSKLKHPNTVRVFDFGQMDDGSLYLAMEFLEGRTLTDLFRKEAPLAPKRLVHIACQVLKALSEAHAKGLVHRDLKPDNIFLQSVHGEADFVKVLDFGIAKSVSGDSTADMTSTGAIIGTPRYMSPEQARGQSVDLRTDLYSLAIILHEGLTGVAPFTADSPLTMLLRRVQEDPPRAQDELAVTTPQGVCDAVYRGLARDAEERFSSADDMAAVLQAGLDTPPVQARSFVSRDQLGVGMVTGMAQASPFGGRGGNRNTSSSKVVVQGNDLDDMGATLGEENSQQLKRAMTESQKHGPPAMGPPPKMSMASASSQGVATLIGGPAVAETSAVAHVSYPPAAKSNNLIIGAAAGAIVIAVAIGVVVLKGSGEPAVHVAAKAAEVLPAPAAVVTAPPAAALAAPVAAAAAAPVAALAPAAAPPAAPLAVGAPTAVPAAGDAKVKLQVEPADARLEIDGTQVIGSEARLAAGKHTIKGSKAGFVDEVTQIEVAAGEIHSVKLELKKSLGTAKAGTVAKSGPPKDEKTEKGPKTGDKPKGKDILLID